ncbi:YeiH family protein [Marivita sp. GX14005]|uniref:YeiH family protein n=1 Tax=Marivita sp. GX14005 TaxID=2942276 RepID=UPI002019CFC7|nr:YeiH family protein [Marivita sp. GX14005]MCL3881490.1 YeiH family protein [Marivita sp. GX14005]
MQLAWTPKTVTTTLRETFQTNIQGFLVATVIAVAAQFLSEHYGAPAMLLALLLGIAFHFLAEEGACKPGIEFTARTVLRIGVALLGVRISAELMIGLGGDLIGLVIAGVVATIGFGLLGARILGRGWRFGLLTGGSVAICGASAAMAISAVLPRNEHSERNLIFTVLSVTVLSTVAMVAYPILAQVFEFNDEVAGVFLGGTIHDVAQVVGAGFSVSEETGEVATLVKLIRVAMLAPVVLVISLVMRRYVEDTATDGKRPPLLPFFVIGFLFFAALNSFGLIPAVVSDAMSSLSRWALLISIAAVGMKTSLKRILDVGGQAILLIVAETIFIAALVLIGVALLGH